MPLPYETLPYVSLRRRSLIASLAKKGFQSHTMQVPDASRESITTVPAKPVFEGDKMRNAKIEHTFTEVSLINVLHELHRDNLLAANYDCEVLAAKVFAEVIKQKERSYPIRLVDQHAAPCSMCGHNSSGIYSETTNTIIPHTCCGHPDCMWSHL